MNRRLVGMIGGGALGLALAFSAAVGSFYPDNRERAATFVTQVSERLGISEAVAQPAAPARFILAGFNQQAAESQFRPDIAVESCDAAGKISRIAFSFSILSDNGKDQILQHPRVQGDMQRYEAQRQMDVERFMKARWELDSDSLVAQRENPAALQTWLESRAQEIYKQTGMQVAFRVNKESAIDVNNAACAVPVQGGPDRDGFTLVSGGPR